MQSIKIEVDNLKCGGCENTIHNSILKLDGVHEVQIDSETSELSIVYEGDKQVTENLIEKKLALLGYPRKGTGNNFQKAKSYVSCAIGKVSVKVNE